jgi:leucyl aminopeptidase
MPNAMIDSLCETDPSAIPLRLVLPDGLEAALASAGEVERAWARANDFTGAAGQVLTFPGADGRVAGAFVGADRVDDVYALAGAAATLPAGTYALSGSPEREAASRLALGWGLASYAFTQYRNAPARKARLAWPAEADRPRVENELEAIRLVRDLVNRPANDLGPAALAEAARAVAEEHGARCTIVTGDSLLESNFPAVHAVGRAAAESPCAIDIGWGDPGRPMIALVGKGITFDSGGLDIKSASNMALMKKDMGGAAHALALGRMIMRARLPVRLRILIAAAENAVGPGANRPGDVIRTRRGLSVEIGDTDAEGRLVLADMLAAASEEDPALILDFATLTGAARVALGPDLPALFATDGLAEEILRASAEAEDPVWRLPLWKPYRKDLDSKVADINNIAGNSFAGAIHAALFLQAFVKPGLDWAHFDLYAWNASARPGRPVGGEAFAIRGLFRMLATRYARAEGAR